MEGVQQSVARFRAAEAGFRRKHDLLRQLWRLADRKHPPVGQIRHRIASLPADLLSELEVRAGRDWHRVFHEDYL